MQFVRVRHVDHGTGGLNNDQPTGDRDLGTTDNDNSLNHHDHSPTHHRDDHG
jgi:hypothetical protein